MCKGMNPVPEGTYIRYLRDKENQIVGTVAFKENEDGTVNRGIAITGRDEQGSRRRGRTIALNRLEIAEKEKKSSRPINPMRGACMRFLVVAQEKDTQDPDDVFPQFKVQANVDPTEHEQHIIECSGN
jgi:hypothetical protein